jgi:carboxypeptidase D
LTQWNEASPGNVYNTPSGLSSNWEKKQFTGLTVLPRVIERSERTLIGHGGLDYILISEGTLLTIQNMTWNGIQGFQEEPNDEFYVPYHSNSQKSAMSGAGMMGKTRTERGLTYFSINLSGHMGNAIRRTHDD